MFLRKYFALLNLAYDFWDPPEREPDKEWKKGVNPGKSFERFRKDVAIMAGFYDPVYRMNGDVVLEAKSISFASMDEDEFADLYSKTIDVLIDKVYGDAHSRKDLEFVVDQILGFV